MKLNTLLLTLLLVVFSHAQAEYRFNEKAPGFFPSVQASIQYEDNVNRTESNTDSDSYYRLASSLDWKVLFGKHALDVVYKGDYGRFNDISEQDYDDHSLLTHLDLDLSEKLGFALLAQYQQGHDRIGDPGSSLLIQTTPDEWTEKTLHGKLTYGRRIANAQFGLALNANERRYTNNGRKFRDRDNVQAIINFNLRIAPKTWLVTELRHQETDFIRPQFISEDSTETNLFVGAEWEATAKTSGKVLLGYTDKSPDDSFFKDYTGFGLEANMTWKPKEYSVVSISAARTPQEGGDNVVSFYIADKFSIRWVHELTELVAFQLGASTEKDDYQSFNREEKYTQFGATLRYLWKRSIETGVRANHIERDSTIINNDYRTNVIEFYIKWTPYKLSGV